MTYPIIKERFVLWLWVACWSEQLRRKVIKPEAPKSLIDALWMCGIILVVIGAIWVLKTMCSSLHSSAVCDIKRGTHSGRGRS